VAQKNPNIDNLLRIVNDLEELADEMVFLGGCAAGLLITDPAAPSIRITIDVDVIVQVFSKGEYYQLAKKLRQKGFSEDTKADAPICRWKSAQGVLLDIMPTDSKVLGFGNQWYQPALQNAENYELENDKTIKLVSAPYFIVTKFEAFTSRGNNDYLMSHDIEDIVSRLDGRQELMDDVKRADQTVTNALSRYFIQHLASDRFIDAVHGHLPGDEVSSQRAIKVLKDMQQIADLQK